MSFIIETFNYFFIKNKLDRENNLSNICFFNIRIELINMKKFLIYLSILIFTILIFLKFFFDPIAKSIISKRLSVDTGREDTRKNKY